MVGVDSRAHENRSGERGCVIFSRRMKQMTGRGKHWQQAAAPMESAHSRKHLSNACVLTDIIQYWGDGSAAQAHEHGEFGLLVLM